MGKGKKVGNLEVGKELKGYPEEKGENPDEKCVEVEEWGIKRVVKWGCVVLCVFREGEGGGMAMCMRQGGSGGVF